MYFKLKKKLFTEKFKSREGKRAFIRESTNIELAKKFVLVFL